MVQNEHSISTFSSSLLASFSSSATSPAMPPAPPPSHSGMPSVDQLSSSSSITFKSIFGLPPPSPYPLMGQVVSRPQVTPTLSPSSAPLSLGVTATTSGSRFRRAFGGRRKKSDTVPPPSPGPDRGTDPCIDESLHSPRQLGPRQLTLQFAQHVFNKKSAPASPALSVPNLPLVPPPPPPPKHAPPSARLGAINTNIDKRISIITTTSPIAPALDYIRKSDEPEQVPSKPSERREFERPESKDVRRKSDSTLSLHTIRPTLGSRTPRPVSLAESLRSIQTVVPMNKRLSALITDAEYVMAEEDDGAGSEEKGRSFARASPAGSLRIRDRRSQSLNLSPPLSLMLSGPNSSNATMSLEAITVTLPRSASEGCELDRRVTKEVATTTFSPLPADSNRDTVKRHVSAISSLNQVAHSAASRVDRTLPELPDPLQRALSAPQTQSLQPSLRQTAISMTSGLAPAAGLARRAVEKMGRVWASKSSISSPLPSPPGEPPSAGRVASPIRSSSGHSDTAYHGHRKVRHNPQTPSVSSVASSISDHEGPQLGKCLRGPLRVSPLGSVRGFVFGRELKRCVEETAIDSTLSVLRTQNVPSEGQEESGRPEHVQWSQPSAPLERRHVPALIVRCAQHILTWGVQEQGLFRVSGRSFHINKLRGEFDTGADFDIIQSSPGDLDPHAVASVFKAFLRELPEPILTSQLMPYFDAAMASERSTNNVQDPPPMNNIHQLRKPPSLSTLAMSNFGKANPPSELLRKTLSCLVSRLPQENRDLLLTVTEVINHTAKRSAVTKMPLSNLLLVLCPSLSMNPSLLQALCETQDVWSSALASKETVDSESIVGEDSPSSDGYSDASAESGEVVGTDQMASSYKPSNERRFVRPLPRLPTADGSMSAPPSLSTCEPSGLPVTGRNEISRVPVDVDTLSSSFCSTDDSSSLSHLSQGGRPVTPTSLNFNLSNPRPLPSLSCSTDSLGIPSSSESPIQLVKPLTLLDECDKQQSPDGLDIAEPIPLPIPNLRPLPQTASEAQFQFPGARDSIIRNPLIHRKSTPSISFSSISSEARTASITSHARRLKKPSLHLLFSKHSPSPTASPVISSPLTASEASALRLSSSTSGSSPASVVTAPQSTRFSYPPVLNTAIDESSISLALGIENDEDTSVGHTTRNDVKDSQGTYKGPPGETGKDTHGQFRHLDVAFPEEDQFGEYNWTQSVLLAAGETGW